MSLEFMRSPADTYCPWSEDYWDQLSCRLGLWLVLDLENEP